MNDNGKQEEIQAADSGEDVILEQGSNKPRNLSTICIHCTRGMVPIKAVESWMGLLTPMNHRFVRIIQAGKDADIALNDAIEQVLAHPVYKNYPYILLFEDDNIVPRDGLLRLLQRIGDYDGLGGLYCTKGIPSFPLILGHPSNPRDFRPMFWENDGDIVECNGTGVGFVLLKTEIFKKLEKPWFRSVEAPEGEYARMQHDLYFFYNAKRQLGCRFAVDTSIKVGHLNPEDGVVYWPSYLTKEETEKLRASDEGKKSRSEERRLKIMQESKGETEHAS